MRTLTQDLRYAVRTLAKRPGFSLVVVLTLALGIGANTAIFSMIRGVLLRPLPYRDGEQLVVLRHEAKLAGVEDAQFSVQEVDDLRARSRSLAGIVEYHDMWFNLLNDGEPERVQTGVVSAEFFDVMGVTPVVGRTFLPQDDDAGAEPVLVLSHEYWMRRFGGDPGVVGRTVEMNDHTHTIVGVLERVPRHPQPDDVYMPTSACPFRASEAWNNNRQLRALNVFARMRAGVTAPRVESELAAISRQMHEEHPDAYDPESGFRIAVDPLRDVLTTDARPTLLVLLAMAGFVLLIACANVANLTLARLLRRESELAVRAALGAGRGRLVRQVVTESVVLGVVGGALGLLLARGGLDLLVAFASRFTPRASEVRIDEGVLLFALAAAVGTGIVFGLLPALSARPDLSAALKESGRSSGGRGSQRLRATLIVAQLAVSFVLLMGAGLMLRSLVKLQHVDPGYRTDNLLAASVALDWTHYGQDDPDGTRKLQFWSGVVDRLRSEPGVRDVAVASSYPLDGTSPNLFDVRIEGRDAGEGPPPNTEIRVAGPDYFKTIGAPLVRGREFAASDDREAPFVVIVNQAFARRYWGDDDPIGDRLSTDGGETWDIVIGVVGDMRQEYLGAEADAGLWYSWLQAQPLVASVIVRTAADPSAISARIREAVRATDPEQPVYDVRTLRQARSDSLASPRLTTLLLALFAALALGISATGIAGLIAFTVSQRTHEIGIRLALGARRENVLAMLLRQGLVLVAAGLALGVLAAALTSKLVRGLLYGVTTTDPLTYAAVAGILLGVGLVACWIPASRATRIPPVTALRVG